jgi:hypothetical protein
MGPTTPAEKEMTMPGSSAAGIITASATVLIAVGGIISALTLFLPALRRTEHKVDEVHMLVNQRFTDMERYQRALVKLLKDKGIAVPDDQSKDPV